MSKNTSFKKNKNKKKKMYQVTPVKPRLTELELLNKPTVIITKEVQNEILYFHSRTGKKEWSGFLLFEQEGTLEDINALRLKTKHIHLLDIGSETFTTYSSDTMEEIIEDLGDVALNYKIGQCHTHHSMGK